MNIKIRKAEIYDLKTVTELCMTLYEVRDFDYLENENKRLLENKNQAVFLVFDGVNAVAFAHCSLRFDYVEATSSSPVGYLEGIYIEPDFRKQDIAKQLVNTCENWAKGNGCTEFASDCDLTNEESYKFHLKIGFIEANRNIHFTKGL